MPGIRSLCLLLLFTSVAMNLPAESPPVLESKQAKQDIAPAADPASAFWQTAPRGFADRDPFGNPVPNHATEIRSRWTMHNLYFLFICHYDELYLKPDPQTHSETNELWNWDVAEAFIGSDFHNIRRYREFEVSPQGEWIDVDIDLNEPHHEHGWIWNSGMQVDTRIDRGAKVWYACMKIPYASLDSRAAAPGNELRINFYRSQGPPASKKEICWQPTGKTTFHVPESFGRLRLVP